MIATIVTELNKKSRQNLDLTTPHSGIFFIATIGTIGTVPEIELRCYSAIVVATIATIVAIAGKWFPFDRWSFFAAILAIIWNQPWCTAFLKKIYSKGDSLNNHLPWSFIRFLEDTAFLSSITKGKWSELRFFATYKMSIHFLLRALQNHVRTSQVSCSLWRLRGLSVKRNKRYVLLLTCRLTGPESGADLG